MCLILLFTYWGRLLEIKKSKEEVLKDAGVTAKTSED